MCEFLFQLSLKEICVYNTVNSRLMLNSVLKNKY